jgi:hypothetical protein
MKKYKQRWLALYSRDTGVGYEDKWLSSFARGWVFEVLSVGEAWLRRTVAGSEDSDESQIH